MKRGPSNDRREGRRPGSEEPFELIPGRNPIREALAAGRKLKRLWIADGNRDAVVQALAAEARAQGIPVEVVPLAALDRKAPETRHQGVLAAALPLATVAVDDLLARAATRQQQPLLVMAAGLQDPHNVGAIIRSAEAAGAHGLILPKHRSAPLNHTVAKASAGAVEHLPVAVVTNLNRELDRLKEQGLWVVGADPRGETVYWEVDWTVPSVLVVGSEGEGMSRLTRETCDFLVRLPMHGRVSSLNASVAAGILLFEAVRQRSLVQFTNQ